MPVAEPFSNKRWDCWASHWGKKELGTLFDLTLDYNLTPNTILGLYASPVRGGRVAGNVYPQNGPHPSANLFYLKLTQRF